MRKLFGWMAGLVGIAALARILAARRAQVARRRRTTIAPPAADPAEELRRKLAEARDEPASGGRDAVDDGGSRADGDARGAARAGPRQGAGGDGRDGRPAGAADVSEQPTGDDVAGALRGSSSRSTALHDEVRRLGADVRPPRSARSSRAAARPAATRGSGRSTRRPPPPAGAPAPARGPLPRGRRGRRGDRRPRRGRDRRRDGRAPGCSSPSSSGRPRGPTAGRSSPSTRPRRPLRPRADPAWFSPPVEHTLLDAAAGDDVTAVTRLPPPSTTRGDGRAAARLVARDLRRTPRRPGLRAAGRRAAAQAAALGICPAEAGIRARGPLLRIPPCEQGSP